MGAVVGSTSAAATARSAALEPSSAYTEPGVAIAFTERSYAPGGRARLVVWSKVEQLSVRIFRVGGEQKRPRRNDQMFGVPAGPARPVRGRSVRIRIPNGQPGLYYLRAVSRSGVVGYAPFVLRHSRPGGSRVLVVIPTNTWQAYNFRDVDRNGLGDTWYDEVGFNGVDLTRPHLHRGVPFHFRQYDLGFLRWMTEHGFRADFIADDDFDDLTGSDLARRYVLVVFPGHEEYVGKHTWDAIETFRDLGGNIAFLSANNFFYRVERRGHRLYRTGRWRDVGRSEAKLKGVEYVGYFEGRYRNRPYVVTGARAAPWLFEGSKLRNGDAFGRYGIEVDARSAESPPGTLAVARIRDIFGSGRSAEMTYYTTKAGAKVFSAGVMNFGGSAEWPVVSKLLGNLWRQLVRP